MALFQILPKKFNEALTWFVKQHSACGVGERGVGLADRITLVVFGNGAGKNRGGGQEED